jgi:type IV secretory pathway TrbD component
MDPVLGIAVGIGLSAASGLRAFVPLLLTSLAARAGYIPLAQGMEWMASDTALLAFGIATVLEIVAYYVPWLDNVLDTLATPTAVTAGVIATAAVTPDLPPLLRWSLAVVGGGTAAGLVQVATVLARLTSSTLTGGLANPVLATGELAGSLILSALALLAPVLALAVALGLIVWAARRAGRILRDRRRTRTLQS